MAEQTKNLGRNVRVRIYVENKALGASWLNVLNWDWQREYWEGEDSYNGKSNPKPWQVCKGASGSFSLEESSALDIGLVTQAIDTAERIGTKPDIKIVEYTDNNDGTTSRVSIPGVVMKYKKAAGGQGEKVKHDFSWRGEVPTESNA